MHGRLYWGTEYLMIRNESEDLSPLMTEKPEAAQCFADTFWEGKPIVFPRNKKGEMKGAAGRNAVPVYTNRRWHAGSNRRDLVVGSGP